jgi:class 3 adenylate cyclase
VAREQRKLEAILAADVVGYSRLMGRDGSDTLARLCEPLFGGRQSGISRYAPQAINPTPTT